MNRTPTITVIVAVYNAEKYLSSCFDSILNQTFKDFELLLIDDGSTDHSGMLCDEYAKKDDRVRVIHSTNIGPSNECIRGVKESNSEWISFVDDDDTLEPDALESLYERHEGTDIVVGFSTIPRKKLKPNSTIDECRKALLSGNLSSPLWGKIYRKKLLDDAFDSLRKEDDFLMDIILNTRIFFKTSKPVHVIYKHIYNYRRNTSSDSHNSKCSIKREETFYRNIYQAIPKEYLPNYMREIVFLKLNGLFPIAYSNPESLLDKGQLYLKQIRADIHQCDYHLSLKEWILMNSTSRLTIKFTGFLELVKRSLSYRLYLFLH